MRTRNQDYALKIYKQVTEIGKMQNKDDRTKYGSLAHKLPILIRTAGLAQALAFIDARGKEPGKCLLRDIESVIGVDNLAQYVRSKEVDLSEYMRLTRAILSALVWYKRFAQSILGVEQGAEAEED